MFAQGFGEAIQLMFIILLLSVPLGLWKLIEIIIWIVQHIRIGIV